MGYEIYSGLDGGPKNTTTEAKTLSGYVNFDLYVTLDEIRPDATWPPNRFKDRDERLKRLEMMWRGDLGPTVDLGENPVVLNRFKTYSTQLANLLLMEDPEAAGITVLDGVLTPGNSEELPGESDGLPEVCFDIIIDLTRYGGAILLRLGDTLAVPEPPKWYPIRDGGMVLAQTWVSDEAETSQADRIDLLVARDGAALTMTFAYGHDRLGRMLATEDHGAAEFEVVRRRPPNGIWGTPKYLDLYTSVVEIARRLSKNSRVLDLYTAPVPTFRSSDEDARQRFGVDSDASDDVARREILEGQLKMLMGETMHLTDDLIDVDYLQPQTVGVEHALNQVETMEKALVDAVGLPDLSGETLSGEALKRRFIHFFAESDQLRNDIVKALERLLGVTVTWPHPFDTDLFAPEEGGPGGANAIPEPITPGEPDPEVE